MTKLTMHTTHTPHVGPPVGQAVIGVDGRAMICVRRGRDLRGRVVVTLVPIDAKPATAETTFPEGTRWITYD